MAEHQWHYLSSGLTGDEQIGPVSETEFLAMIKEGKIKPKNKVASKTRTKGNWYEAQSVPALKKLFNKLASQRTDENLARKNIRLEEKQEELIAEEVPVVLAELKPKWETECKILVAIIIAAFILTLVFSSFFPWLSLLSAITLVAFGITYAAWPALSERIASFQHRPDPPLPRRLCFSVPIVLYAVVLLALSQSQIRGNWREAAVRADVNSKIELANSAIDLEDADEALRICNLIEPQANSSEKKQVTLIRDQAKSIENKQLANKIISEGRQHVKNQELDKAQSSLVSVFEISVSRKLAIDFANEIVAARLRKAREFYNKDDLLNAKDMAEQAINVPSATVTTDARRFIPIVCNRQVNKLVGLAREALEKKNREEAASLLEQALAIRGATETEEAESLFAPFVADGNELVNSLIGDAQEAADSKRFSQAIRILNSAAAVSRSSKNQEVTEMIALVTKQRDKELGRKKAMAKYEQKRKENAKKAITEQFSSWNGSHINLTKTIKESMNDPKSYVHDKTVYRQVGNYLIVTTTFRGKNAFGGVVKNSITAKVDMNGNVIDIISQYVP